MGYYEARVRLEVEGALVDEAFKSFDSEKEARAFFEEKKAGIVDALHRWIARDAGAAESAAACSYGEGTRMEVSLHYGDGGADGSGELVDEAAATSEEVFERFGRTGGAWKVEVVSRDADDEVTDILDSFTVYPGGDWEGLAREALAREARQSAGNAGVAAVELYVIECVEVDDDGGDGQGDVVLHEAIAIEEA